MASVFAAPARRGDFFYSSVLYADPGNNNPHTRASIAELAALLRPEASKLYSQGHKPNTASPAKDPAWHYYAAQCIHYGLPVTKDKNAAKVRLLNALNQFKLEVPAWILALEGELKKEWEGQNKKIKKGKDGGSSKTGGKSENTTKVKNSATIGCQPVASAAGNNSVSVTVNLFHPNTAHPYTAALAAPSASTPKKPAQPKRKRSGSDALLSTPNKTSKKTDVYTPPNRSKKTKATHDLSTTTVKQEYDGNQPSFSSTPLPQNYQYKLESPPPCSQMPDSISPYGTFDFITNHNNISTTSASGSVLSGTYMIDCEEASALFKEPDFDLSLARDPNRGIWWSTFRWGDWDAILRTDSEIVLGQPCPLKYRLRNLASGQLTFRRDCTGSLTCWANGDMEGVLCGVPDVEDGGVVQFRGYRVAGEESVQDDLQEEWEGFVKETYLRY